MRCMERKSGPKPRHQRRAPQRIRLYFRLAACSLAYGTYPSVIPSSVDPSFPNPELPAAVQSGQSVEDWNPLTSNRSTSKAGPPVSSAKLDKNTVIDVRYVANHGVGLWSTVVLMRLMSSEMSTEATFLQQFQTAQNNLAIANGISVAQLLTPGQKIAVSNYGNTGLPGQVAVPILTTAIPEATPTRPRSRSSRKAWRGATANAIATNAHPHDQLSPRRVIPSTCSR